MSRSPSEITYEMSGLGEVISSTKLTIPPNQREYSWEYEQVDALLQDIAKAINTGGDYFIGTIVGIPSEDKSRLVIVDGQQRLATTCIFLAEMMRFFNDRDQILAQSVREILFSVDRSKRATLPNLRMGKIDNDYFINLLDDEVNLSKKTKFSSIERMQSARTTAEAKIKSITNQFSDNKDKCDQLNQWLDYIERHVKVLVLTVGSNASAYKMFETLNDRGLKTTQGDLVKNFLFGEAGDDRFDEVEHKWNAMKSILGSISDKDITIDFLRLALTCVIKYTREQDVFEHTEDYATSPQACVNYVIHMEDLAQAYAALKMPEHEKWSGKIKDARHYVRRLIVLNVKPLIPLQLAIIAKFKDLECKKAMKFMVSLNVRLLVTAGTRSGATAYTAGDISSRVYKEEIRTLEELKVALKDLTPNDPTFTQAFESFKSATAELSRYYLRTIEKVVKKQDPWYSMNEDESEVNLEHIYPKNPMGNYPGISDDESPIYLNRLGNQTLLLSSINSDLKSSPFSEKKEGYKGSPYVITKELSECDGEWDSEKIIKRQKNMAKYCCKAWPI